MPWGAGIVNVGQNPGNESQDGQTLGALAPVHRLHQKGVVQNTVLAVLQHTEAGSEQQVGCGLDHDCTRIPATEAVAVVAYCSSVTGN